MEELRTRLARAVEEEDAAPYLLALEPLFETFDPAEVAAAAVALLRKKEPVAQPSGASAAQPDRQSPVAWVKLFLTVGDREGLRPGDLLGAILGETGISREKVGKIEIRESFSLVEVDHTVAQQTVQALNGTTIRGRSVRADFDRGGRDRPRPGGRTGSAGRGGKPVRHS
jgi:ATP-dependent RNA helicase DeaD